MSCPLRRAYEGSDLPTGRHRPPGLLSSRPPGLQSISRACRAPHRLSAPAVGFHPVTNQGICPPRYQARTLLGCRSVLTSSRVLGSRSEFEPVLAPASSSEEPRGTPFHEVWFPTACSSESSDLHRAYLTRLCYAYRLSQPPDVLFRSRPIGLVSCRSAPGIPPSEGSPVW